MPSEKSSKVLRDLNVAVEKRKRLFQRIQAAFDLTSRLTDEVVVRQFRVRCQVADQTYQEFEANQDRIVEFNSLLEEEERLTDIQSTSTAFEDLYFRVKAAEASLPTTAQVSTSMAMGSERPRLPIIHIPAFDGSYENFSSFRSLFDTMVHSQISLSTIEKYSYLRSLVSGSALACIQGFDFSEESYQLAYDTLVTQFSNKRVVANNICRKLWAIKPLSSPSQLQYFLDTFNVYVESLKAVKIPELGDFLLLFMGLRLLDTSTRQEFETRSLSSKEIPTYKNLLDFVRSQVSVSDLIDSTPKPVNNRVNVKSHLVTASKRLPDRSREISVRPAIQIKSSCPQCTESHKLNQCSKFLAMPISQRYNVLREKKMCFSCLGPHLRLNCGSKFACRECGSKDHHTLLHFSTPVKKTPECPAVPSLSCGVVPSCSDSSSPKQVLLGTAVVTITDIFGKPHEARVLVDPGSMVTIMTESLCQRLCLPLKSSHIRIAGLGSNNVQPSRGIVSCTLVSKDVRFLLPVDAVVLPQISGSIPAAPVSQAVVDRLSQLPLADPGFYKPASIDILLGAQYYADILHPNSFVSPGEPSLLPSKFGILIMGIAESSPMPSLLSSMFISTGDNELFKQLRKFWEMEEVCVKVPENPEDVECEEHFKKTTRREKSGTYVVRLPFRHGTPPDLGNNRHQALVRLHRLEASLNRNLEFKELYHANLQEYLDLGHMVEALDPSDYLLMHHGVLKESSSTTKFRVVFSPAERSSPSHVSLNQSLLTGPKLQANISDLMLNFRLNQIAITADIKQMYLGIKLDPRDSHYQQIFWRTSPEQPVKQYEIQKVCFGVASSPFQAQRVLKQLILDEGSRYPSAARVLDSDIYIDDICSGACSVEDAQKLRLDLSALLATAGFELRKWSCSHPEVLKGLSLDFLEKPHKIGDIETIRVLGLQWDPKEDSFIYFVDPIPTCHTKRQLLSQIARIYDVSGFVSPVTIWMKILLQRLWVRGSDWDEEIPSDLLSEWESFTNDLTALEDLRIPRYILDTLFSSPELVGFADASTVAMGACVYLRVVCSDQRVLSNLIRAKSRVAPLKTCTIPRLELCAAYLLSQTVKALEPLIKRLNIHAIHLFSDSRVFLSWLNTPPHMLKIFVANRIVKILEVTTASQWNHISTELNPADLASRGCMPSQLADNNLWWSGPDFLRNDISEWPSQELLTISNLPELKEVSTSLVTQLAGNDAGVTFIQRFSSFTKAKRTMAWIMRFKTNAALAKEKRNLKSLTVQEIRNAEKVLVRITQSYYLPLEIAAARQGHPSKMFRSLTPFLDNDVLRVGGRLFHAPIPYDARHPVILPVKCHLAKLIVEYYHLTTLHGGNKIVHCLVQRSYYIPRLRELVRKTIYNCPRCIRFVALPNQPFMSNLPVSRFAQGRPFIHTGVDLAGPYPIKDGSRRNSPINKSYFAIFICFATKAIHLELLTSLSTDCFFAAFDRFIARRGLPSSMFSDRGTNFIGASRVLDETFKFLKENEHVLGDYLVGREIQWTFNAPANPSAGGLWEAGVKSVKHHLKRLLSDRPLMYEEFCTLLARIEAILNSRPLGVPASCPIDEISCLTPGHFLIGAPLLSRPEVDIAEIPSNRVPRWDLLRQISQHFWKRWAQEYLQSLIHRQKWWERIDNVKVGDVVVIMVENQPPTQWPLARITALCPAKDGVVRIVSLRTASGQLTRPVRKLLVLPTMP